MPSPLEGGVFEQGVRAIIEEKLALLAFCSARDEQSVVTAEASFNDARARCLDFELIAPSDIYMAMKQEARERLSFVFEETDVQGGDNNHG